jgi:hypothetical protein
MTTFGWVWAGLISAVLVSARHLYIKRFCSTVPAEALILATRVFGAIVLTPFALARGLRVDRVPAFAGTLAVTVVLTALATIIQIRVIQRDAVSRAVPYLNLIPLFMIPWTILLLREYPSKWALLGIGMSCGGAWLLNGEDGQSPGAVLKHMISSRSVRMMLASSLALGATSTCDKIAIGASSAFTYSYVWTSASIAAMLLCCGRLERGAVRASLLNGHVLVQALFWMAGFFAQMHGVQLAIGIPSGVTYVKVLTLSNVLMTVAAGGHVFGEGRVARSFSAALMMSAGAVLTVMSAR